MNFLRKFMYGRYGVDQFSMFLMVLSIVLSIVFRLVGINYLYFINSLILVYVLYRTFSKDTNKRYRENYKFITAVKPVTSLYRKLVRRFNDRKEYKYFTCVQCKQELRLPKGKGKIQVTCPKCKSKYTKRT